MRIDSIASPIFVFDNGRDYSDHWLAFVEPTVEELPYFTDFVDAWSKAWPLETKGENPRFIGRVDAGTWSAPRMLVSDFLYKIDESGLWRLGCVSVAEAKRAATLAAVLVPGYWSFYSEQEFVEL